MHNCFINRLIEIRAAFGLSGYSFAKKLGIPQPTYLRYEMGIQKPSGKLIESLVLICHVNVYWLYTGEGPMFIDFEQNTFSRQNDVTVEERCKNFGKRMSRLQEKHNFLDREMAKLLNISEKHYLSLVVGAVMPGLDILNNIKRNFKVSIDYLLYGDGEGLDS